MIKMHVIQYHNIIEFLERLQMDAEVRLVWPRSVQLSRFVTWKNDTQLFDLGLSCSYETNIKQHVRLLCNIGELTKDDAEVTVAALKKLDEHIKQISNFCKTWHLDFQDLDTDE